MFEKFWSDPKIGDAKVELGFNETQFPCWLERRSGWARRALPFLAGRHNRVDRVVTAAEEK